MDSGKVRVAIVCQSRGAFLGKLTGNLIWEAGLKTARGAEVPLFPSEEAAREALKDVKPGYEPEETVRFVPVKVAMPVDSISLFRWRDMCPEALRSEARVA